MKCKNKEIVVDGLVSVCDVLEYRKLYCICTNDERGKTLSIDDGTIQFSIPMEQIAPCFEGDYRR